MSEYLVISLIPIFFVFVIFFMRIIARNFGGWKYLERKYATKKNPEDLQARNLKISQCNIGGMSASNLFKFYESKKGLLITPVFIVRKEETNVLIPWNQFAETTTKKIFFGKTGKITIGKPALTYLEFSGRNFTKIEHLVPRQ